MFSKEHRLAKTKDISLVYTRGRSFFSPFFVVKFMRQSKGVNRFTVVVSTKVSKKAVVRNKLKRVVREFLRLRASILEHGDYIVTVRGKAVGKPNTVLREELNQLLVKSRLLAASSLNT